MTGEGRSQANLESADLRTKVLRVGGLRVDPMENTVTSDGTGDGEAVHLEPKIMDVLLALCARQGEVVSREALIDAVWSAQYGADESLTRAISILRKALQGASADRRAIETFSKRGYRLNLPVEIDSGEHAGGVGKGVKASARAPGAVWWRRWGVPAAGLAAAGLVAGTLWLMRDTGAQASQAVTSAAGSGRVAIEPWSAALPAHADVARAGAPALGAAFAQRGVASHILRPEDGEEPPAMEFRVSGDVRMRSEELVVRVRLTDFATGEVLWVSEREQDGVEAVSAAEGASAHLANVTECALSARRRHLSPMPREALPAWLRYCDGAWSDDHALTMDAAERLIGLAPDEAPARTAYAKALSWQYAGATEDESELWRARVDRAIESVLEVDPESIDALALSAAMHPNDWDRMEMAIRALESADRSQRDGNEDLHYFLLRSVGYLDAALRQAAIMKARLPGPTHLTEEAWLMSTAGMRTRALQQLDEVIRLYPENYNAYWRRFNILALSPDRNHVETALFQVERGIYPGKTDAQMPCWRSYLLARLEQIDPENALSEDACLETMYDFRARLHGALGQVDEALENTRQALDGADNDALRGNTIHLFYPEMAEVRQDPRFWREVDKIGLVDFWRSYGRWPDFCSDRRVTVDCPAMAEAAIAARAG